MSDGLLHFASPEWVDLARKELEDLVGKHGELGLKYSICEAFVDAPSDIADENGELAWHLFVDGKDVQVGCGRAETDIIIQATYELALPGARLVYTPELIEEWKENPPERPDDPNLKTDGDMSAIPKYLGELHNRLAVVTA